jgi:hypothetical protein
MENEPVFQEGIFQVVDDVSLEDSYPLIVSVQLRVSLHFHVERQDHSEPEQQKNTIIQAN